MLTIFSSYFCDFQPLIHLFSIPDDAFESDDGESSDEEVNKG